MTKFELPPLPYGYDALEPTVSAETMRLHHDKHHAKYFETTNKLLADSGASYQTLEDVVVAAKQGGQNKLKNNAGQAWNHTFFWTCMAADRSAPSGELLQAIDATFGSLDALKAAFVAEGVGHFASGWVWLSMKGGSLVVDSTHDGDNHLGEDDVVPLLVCDLWEHAYYVDYRNDREGFLKAWFDSVPNWSFAAEQYAAAAGGGAPWRHPGPSAA